MNFEFDWRMGALYTHKWFKDRRVDAQANTSSYQLCKQTWNRSDAKAFIKQPARIICLRKPILWNSIVGGPSSPPAYATICFLWNECNDGTNSVTHRTYTHISHITSWAAINVHWFISFFSVLRNSFTLYAPKQNSLDSSFLISVRFVAMSTKREGERDREINLPQCRDR